MLLKLNTSLHVPGDSVCKALLRNVLQAFAKLGSLSQRGTPVVNGALDSVQGFLHHLFFSILVQGLLSELYPVASRNNTWWGLDLEVSNLGRDFFPVSPLAGSLLPLGSLVALLPLHFEIWVGHHRIVNSLVSLVIVEMLVLVLDERGSDYPSCVLVFEWYVLCLSRWLVLFECILARGSFLWWSVNGAHWLLRLVTLRRKVHHHRAALDPTPVFVLSVLRNWLLAHWSCISKPHSRDVNMLLGGVWENLFILHIALWILYLELLNGQVLEVFRIWTSLNFSNFTLINEINYFRSWLGECMPLILLSRWSILVFYS